MSSDHTSSVATPVNINDTGVPFVHPGEILAAATVLPALGMILISLRFWSRMAHGAGIKADDWTILAALPFTVAMAVMMIYGVAEHSLGYPSPPDPVHLSSILLEKFTETTPQQDVVFIVYWVTWLLMILANGLIKLSALFMYRRVFVVNKNGLVDIVIKFMFIVCLLWTVGFFFAQLFGCGLHFERPFGNLEAVASCNTNVRLNALMISDLLTDILVWIIPFPVVWTLNMTVRKKFAVTGILLLATISLVAAAIRLKVELGIADGGYSINVDDNQVLTVNVFWSNIESSLALIAACLPALKLGFLGQKFSQAMMSVQSLLGTSRRSPSYNTKSRDDNSSINEHPVSQEMVKGHRNLATQDV